jgi:hypothetical protein
MCGAGGHFLRLARQFSAVVSKTKDRVWSRTGTSYRGDTGGTVLPLEHLIIGHSLSYSLRPALPPPLGKPPFGTLGHQMVECQMGSVGLRRGRLVPPRPKFIAHPWSREFIFLGEFIKQQICSNSKYNNYHKINVSQRCLNHYHSSCCQQRLFFREFQDEARGS